jgi:glycosyltransferase involved in cell wall biosynthesis
MRILFTKQSPLDAPGGEINHLFANAREMQAMGIEVHLMPVTDHPTPAGLWQPDRIHEIRPFGLHHLFDSIPLSQAVARFSKETRIDAVLSWQYETANLPEFLPRRNFVLGVVAGAPFGLLKRKADADLARRVAYHFFHFRLLRNADVIFCPSEFAKRELVNAVGIDPGRIVVTYESADEIFKPNTEPKTGPLHDFIFSGSLEPIKGIFDAIQALGIVQRRGYRDWVLKIAGWGDIEAVREAARRNEIEDHIQFLGVLNRPALAVELASSDMAILPSHTDNFGLSIAEAEASGLPIVSYRAGGIPEEVEEGSTALLVDLLDTSLLAEAIIQLISDPQKAREMGQRGSRFIRENFSWRKSTEIMIDSIRHLTPPVR